MPPRPGGYDPDAAIRLSPWPEEFDLEDPYALPGDCEEDLLDWDDPRDLSLPLSAAGRKVKKLGPGENDLHVPWHPPAGVASTPAPVWSSQGLHAPAGVSFGAAGPRGGGGGAEGIIVWPPPPFPPIPIPIPFPSWDDLSELFEAWKRKRRRKKKEAEETVEDLGEAIDIVGDRADKPRAAVVAEWKRTRGDGRGQGISLELGVLNDKLHRMRRANKEGHRERLKKELQAAAAAALPRMSEGERLDFMATVGHFRRCFAGWWDLLGLLLPHLPPGSAGKKAYAQAWAIIRLGAPVGR